MRLRQIVGGVHMQVAAASGNLVQVRLPEVRARTLDQRHMRQALLGRLVAQSGGQLQPASTAADDDDDDDDAVQAIAR